MGPAQIPVLDTLVLDQKNGRQLLEAVSQWGFVFIRNQGTGFGPDLLDQTFYLAHKFFASPREEKAKYAITANNRGWSSMHSETLDPAHQKRGDFKEALNFGEFVAGKAQQPIPRALAEHEQELSQFSRLCHEVCLRILRLFAVGLQIEGDDGGADWFSTRHDPERGPSGSILRFLYYPALAATWDYDGAVDIRAGAHSDYGSITLLFQRPSQPGLEILTPTSTWSPVPVFPRGTEGDSSPPILVNVGDLLSYWTNGLMRSTVHRVICAKDKLSEDRYSIAYFCHPANDTKLVPIPSKMIQRTQVKSSEVDRDPGTADGITAEEHLRERLAATYGWNDNEE